MAKVYSVDEIMDLLRSGQLEGMEEAAELIGDLADQHVPTDTGRLKDSRRVTVEPDQNRVEISYGADLDDPRAVVTHEDMTARHDDGGPKYLERALAKQASNSSQAARLIAEAIKQRMS